MKWEALTVISITPQHGASHDWGVSGWTFLGSDSGELLLISPPSHIHNQRMSFMLLLIHIIFFNEININLKTRIQIIIYSPSYSYKPYHFLLWNTKGDIKQNVHAALSHSIKVNGDQKSNSKNDNKKVIHTTCAIFQSCNVASDGEIAHKSYWLFPYSFYGAFCCFWGVRTYTTLYGKKQHEHSA